MELRKLETELTSLKAPVYRIAKAAAVSRSQLEECERVLGKAKNRLEHVSSTDPALAQAMRRLDQLEAGLGVAKSHAEHELNVARLLNAHGPSFIVEHETQSDLPPAWAAREQYLLAKRKKRQVDDAQIASAQLAQPKLAQVVAATVGAGKAAVADPSKRCWRCNRSGHISLNCPKGAGPLTFKTKGRGKKGKK